MNDVKRTAPLTQSDAEEPIMVQPANTKKSGLAKIIVTLILVVVVILVGLYIVSRFTSWNILNVNKTATAPADAKGWSAVFLTNGQVYFGKIANQNDKNIVLKEIYYLQVAQSPQPAPEGQTAQQNISLVKLGNELHGPEDAMNINMAQVLFTEALKKDSRVVEAILKYLEDNKK